VNHRQYHAELNAEIARRVRVLLSNSTEGDIQIPNVLIKRTVKRAFHPKNATWVYYVTDEGKTYLVLIDPTASNIHHPESPNYQWKKATIEALKRFMILDEIANA
jgi:hypothetical protein